MKHRKWSEAALVQGLCRGHGQMTDYYYHYLLQKAKRKLVLSHSSWQSTMLEDCFTEAFIMLVKKLRAGKWQCGKLDAFALAIVRNYFRDACKRERSLYLEDDRREIVRRKMYETVNSPSDVSALFGQFNYTAHIDWLDQLSDRDRRLLNLRLWGYDQKDCAEILGLAHGSVRNIYQRLFREARDLMS